MTTTTSSISPGPRTICEGDAFTVTLAPEPDGWVRAVRSRARTERLALGLTPTALAAVYWASQADASSQDVGGPHHDQVVGLRDRSLRVSPPADRPPASVTSDGGSPVGRPDRAPR